MRIRYAICIGIRYTVQGRPIFLKNASAWLGVEFDDDVAARFEADPAFRQMGFVRLDQLDDDSRAWLEQHVTFDYQRPEDAGPPLRPERHLHIVKNTS